MRRVVTGLVLACLAGCGGPSDRQVLIQECLKTQTVSEKVCDCMADEAEKSLDPALISKAADALRAGEDGADIPPPTPEEEEQISRFLLNTAISCGFSD